MATGGQRGDGAVHPAHDVIGHRHPRVRAGDEPQQTPLRARQPVAGAQSEERPIVERRHRREDLTAVLGIVEHATRIRALPGRPLDAHGRSSGRVVGGEGQQRR